MFQEMRDELVTIDEMQEMLKVGRTTAYQLLNTGEIKAFRIGRFWKIPRAAITEYVSRKPFISSANLFGYILVFRTV